MSNFKLIKMAALRLTFGTAIFSGVLVSTGCLSHNTERSGISFVRDGQPTGLIVLAATSSQLERDAVAHFTEAVARSTGVELAVVDEAEAQSYPVGYSRIFVGNSKASEAAGIHLPEDVSETYRIATRGNDVFIIGRDPQHYWRSAGVHSRPVLWALNRLLEEQLGIRWLWPGELGTHTPARDNFVVPQMDLSYQPELMIRWLRINRHRPDPLVSVDPVTDKRLTAEAAIWLENHQVGRRGNVRFGHAFTDWWDKYSADHPDYFALPPEGMPQRRPTHVNLRLANPAVIERIAKEYIAAGSPEYYNVSPNDGAGFDTSEETRAWDIPPGQPVRDIWLGRAQLTARYVKFWNLLYQRLREINPDVKLATYAYSAYRQPPPPERPLTARMFIGIVDTYDNYVGWSGWSDSGAEMMLRPNWWFQGGNAPYIPLTQTADFIRFAAQNGMKAMDMDSILGYWSTQGINYYLAARLMTQPELTRDDIVAEYASAFGPAAKEILAYIDYWERLTDIYNYPMNATGGLRPETVESRYEDLVRQGKIPHSILNGSKYVLPYLYTDEVIEPALEILAQARNQVPQDSLYARRILFLELGLEELRETRDLIAFGQKLKRDPNPERLREFTQRTAELEAFRESLADDHVLWAETVRWHEDRYNVLIRPQHLNYHNVDLEGQ